MKKRILCMFLTMLLAASVVLPANAAAGDEFSGTRSLQITADWSDLENYVNGGRTAFDQILRANMPEWFAYDIHTQGRDVTCTFSFSFTSFEDYQSKLAMLIMRSPAILYSREKDLLLMESCMSYDLLNFLENALNQHNCLLEKTLQEIFPLTGSSIDINGQVYDASAGVYIRPEESEAVLMDYLSVQTDTKKNNSYSRTITAQVGSGSDADDLERQFSGAGDPEVHKIEGGYEVTVSFEAVSQTELVSKTMQCLNAPTFISERQTPVDGKTVQVERTEFFDIDHLLEEEGVFSYTYNYPSYYDQPIPEKESIQIADSCVRAEGESFVIFTYQRKLQFSSLEICTDLSAPSGKITRTVILTLPLEIAEEYHKNVTDRLRLNLVNGSVMDIYDEGDKRYYQISFSSFLHREIEEFTASVLDDPKYKFDASFSWIPMAKNIIQESFQTDDMISHIVPADEITATYILPEWSNVKESGNAAYALTGSAVTFQIRSKDKISLVYRQVNMVGLGILIAGAVLVLVMILRVVRRIRGKAGRTRKARTKVPVPSRGTERVVSGGNRSAAGSYQVRFCGECGTRIETEGNFCQECGARIERR